MNACIHISEDGTARCLWTEEMPLHEIGRLEIKRASTVEFNPDSQQWEVRLMGSKGIDFSHPSRAVCIAWEVETLNKRLAGAA